MGYQEVTLAKMIDDTSNSDGGSQKLTLQIKRKIAAKQQQKVETPLSKMLKIERTKISPRTEIDRGDNITKMKEDYGDESYQYQ